MAKSDVLPSGLSAKEEALCHAYFVVKTKIDAYIEIYKNGKAPKNMNTAHTECLKIFNRPKVKARLAYLVSLSEVASTFNIDQAHREAELAYHVAFMMREPQSMIKATKLRAELNGLIIKRNLTAKKPLREMSHQELVDEIKVLGEELGIQMKLPKLIQGERIK